MCVHSTGIPKHQCRASFRRCRVGVARLTRRSPGWKCWRPAPP